MSFPVRSYLRRPRAAAPAGYTPPQLAAYYSFPPLTGAGRTVAIIELGGGFVQAHLDAYFKSLGVAPKPVVVVNVDGAHNSPGGDADGEVYLDLCVVGAMAPGATMRCYFAPNTDSGFLHAIQQAVADGVDAISISWGGPEDAWDRSTMQEFDVAFQAAVMAGIPVFAAAGDSGSSDGERGQHVDYPASSPFVIGCGGTSVRSMSPLSEVVWNDGAGRGSTGGGTSAEYLVPAWQKAVNVPGATMRGVPDVAGCADPETGWIVTVGGQSEVIGGTSAVAPMWAALAVLVAEAAGRPLHADLLYATAASWARDVVTGNNGADRARAGYDLCTGLGVPDGTALLAALQASGTPPAEPPSTDPARALYDATHAWAAKAKHAAVTAPVAAALESFFAASGLP